MMKTFTKSLASIFCLIVLLSSVVKSVDAAAWVGHKFMIELPDGTKKDLKGAKLHIFHKQHEDGGATAFTNTCYYPDKEPIGDSSEWADKVRADIGDSHCGTPSSCSIIDYGAPYLPADFNDGRDVHSGGGIYERDNASYKAFYGKTFSDALKEFGFANLADKYQKGNIRGFEGARWQGTVDFSANDSKGPIGFASQDEINQLNNNPDWGKNIRYIDGTQRWQVGEVYRDPQGDNVLHGRITWVLKTPEVTLEKPTATLAGKCATTNPGTPSYSYTLSNIDLKGGTFKSSHLHLNVTKGAWTDEFKQKFGPPIYESTDANGIITYSLIFTTAAPTNNTINWTVAPTEGVGNQATNTQTVADLVKWVDAKKAAGVTIPFEIVTNLEAEKDGKTVLNDSIKVASGGFKPKFVTDECGTTPPPVGGMCVSVNLEYADAARAGQIVVPSNLKIGDSVKAVCGTVQGAQYSFRVISPETPNGLVSPASSSNKSVAMSINKAGSYTVQCGICMPGQACKFEPLPGQPTTSTPPVPSDASCVGPNGESSYSCVPAADCPRERRTNPANVCNISTQVCCAPESLPR